MSLTIPAGEEITHDVGEEIQATTQAEGEENPNTTAASGEEEPPTGGTTDNPFGSF